MGFIPFQPSRRSNSFTYEQMTPTSAATIANGEPVQRNSSAPSQIEAATGGSTVTGIIGVSLEVVTSGTPAFGSTITIARADEETWYLGQIYDVSAGALATAATATHVGNTYGIIEPTAGQWYVDEEDTSDVVVTVMKVITEWNACLFKWITTAIGA